MRKDVISWDDYFMALTKLSAMRSKDPNTQVGACIVNNKKRIIGLGYNGMPSGNDESFPWKREGNTEDTKYAYVVHAEINAVLNATVAVEGAMVYTSLFPCSNCAKTLVQAGIVEVVFLNDFYNETIDAQIARKILNESNVKYRQIENKEICL